MPDRLAFTAEPWGNAAVVYRAMEDCPGPIVDQEFGMLWTWTQTHTFATLLSEGLELDPLEARQIIARSFHCTSDLKNKKGPGGLAENVSYSGRFHVRVRRAEVGCP
jgi:hypothetical protein